MATDQTEVTLELLADVARSFCARDAERVRSLRDAGAWLDTEMWRRIADNGWLVRRGNARAAAAGQLGGWLWRDGRLVQISSA
jgi:hypothetical protein